MGRTPSQFDGQDTGTGQAGEAAEGLEETLQDLGPSINPKAKSNCTVELVYLQQAFLLNAQRVSISQGLLLKLFF